MLKHLTFKEFFKFSLATLLTLFINLLFTYWLNQTDKYILVKSAKVFDFIYISKDYGFILFTTILLCLVLFFILLLHTFKQNYDHLQIKILLNIYCIFLFSISILNYKRNLLLQGLLSDHLVLILTLFISYVYYFWTNLSKLYRVIKIPFVFINSENKIYIKFQYVYMWIYVYILFSLTFLSQMIPSSNFYFILIMIGILDIILKNTYLYYMNLQKNNITTVTMIRHGRTAENEKSLILGWTDSKLDSVGKTQSSSICNKIKSVYDIYQCTPLIRTYQTLDIIASNMNVIITVQLNEYAIERNFGSQEMIWRDPNIKNYFENYDGYINNIKQENFETNKQLNKRVKKYLKFTKKYYKGNSILIVSHSHFIKGVLSEITKENYFKYKIPNCSITNFEIDKDKIKLISTEIGEYTNQ